MIRPNTRKVWLSVSCLLALSACVLQPANAAMQPIFAEPADVQIQGVVIGVMRKY